MTTLSRTLTAQRARITAKNVRSLLKRSLKGSYVAVGPFHPFRYIGEQAFRYNNRTMTETLRFVHVVRHFVGRRLTYKELTGRTERSNMAERPKNKEAGARETGDSLPMTVEQFEASPDFRKFMSAMRKILRVSKRELDSRGRISKGEFTASRKLERSRSETQRP